MLDLPDVNVWLALSSRNHSHHHRASIYWAQESRPQLAFVPTTMLGLLRLSTNSTVMKGAPLTPLEAWGLFLAWLDEPNVTMLQGPAAFQSSFDAWVRSGAVSVKDWADAYLAAAAKATGARIVSFDRGIAKFKGPDQLILL